MQRSRRHCRWLGQGRPQKTLGAALLALVATASVTGCGASSVAADGDGGLRPAQELRVVQAAVEPRLLLTGELVVERAIELYAPDAAIRPMEIRWIAEDGASVAPGDPVVEFDNEAIASRLEDLERDLEQAQQTLKVTRSRVAAEIARAELKLRQKQAALDRARLDAEVPAELQPRAEYEDRQLELNKARLELDQAQQELVAAQAGGQATVELDRLKRDQASEELRRARRDLDLLAMRAPQDGLVLFSENMRERRPWQVGDQVWPSERLARIPDLGSLEVEASLSDVDDGRLAPGMTATVTPDAFPELELEARVRSIDGLADVQGPDSANRSFGVRLSLVGSVPSALRPGMSVRVLVAEEAEDEMPVVPRSALAWEEKGPRLLLAGGEERPVRLGACDAHRCAVLAPAGSGAEGEGSGADESQPGAKAGERLAREGS